MRSLLKNALIISLFAGLVFGSCSKNNPRTNTVVTPPPTAPSLSGQVFQFDSLTWIFFDGRFDVGLDDIYIQTPARPDLFPWVTYSTFLNAEVLLKFDTASNWIDVKSVDSSDPTIPVQFNYWVNRQSLVVHMFPLNYQLVGRRASIKIKFL